MGFKEYEELIFAKNSTTISPFTEEQWNSMMQWYKIMSLIAGSLILIVVVIVAYKFIIAGYNIEQRNEAKDSLMRLFFGAISIIFAPIFVKFLLFINNSLVHIIVGYSNRNLNDLLGTGVLKNIQTGNAIVTSIIIALFAYLFFKLNVKFIIRHFTILVFTLFTPIVSILWMINKRTIGAAIWFGQILINVFMQFIYAFLFLVYIKFLPEASGWAVSILWAMMILPIADALQNCLQNLVSRIAGINNDELANRGIGMANAMAHSIRTIAYQFKNTNVDNNIGNSLIGRIFNNQSMDSNNQIKPMQITQMETTTMKTNKMDTKPINIIEKSKEDTKQGFTKPNFNTVLGASKKMYNTGKEFLNMGMYMAEGKNFKTDRNNINNFRKEENKKTEENILTDIQESEKL